MTLTTMPERNYTVILERDAEVGVYAVRVPSLPRVFTQGATVDEALANAREAIQLHVECLEADGLPVPPDDGGVVTRLVSVGSAEGR